MENRIKKKPTGSPQIKVCGLTSVDEALGCATLGADAIGLVFYPKSPRNVTVDQAKDICLALPSNITTVGVFVNESFSYIKDKVDKCSLKAVQLHGQEPPELVDLLRKENLTVIKVLFIDKKPSLEEAPLYNASAYLVECGGGRLPGGNALEWNWENAKGFGERYPLVLAGGLSYENIKHAVSASMPDAVDVSSSVEIKPGKKDLAKVESFIDEVARCQIEKIANKKKIVKIF